MCPWSMYRVGRIDTETIQEVSVLEAHESIGKLKKLKGLTPLVDAPQTRIWTPPSAKYASMPCSRYS